MRSAVLVVLLLSLAGAGCLSDSTNNQVPAGMEEFAPFVPPEPDFDFSTVVEPDHASHSLPSLHTAGHGLDLVGHTGVGDLLPTTTRGSITAIDIWDHYAVVSGMEGGLAFVIVDI